MTHWKLILLIICLIINQASLYGIEKEETVQRLFVYIQDKDSKLRDKVIQDLINMGENVIPEIEKQFQKTNNPIYLYIITKIRQSNSSGESIDLQKKEEDPIQKYLLNHILKAERLISEGKKQEALKILDAVITLEPQTPFMAQVQKLKQEAESFLIGTIESSKILYVLGEKVYLTLAIKNENNKLPGVAINKPHFLLYIVTTDFFPSSATYSQTQSLSIPIDQTITLSYGERWTHSLSITPPPSSESFCYRIMKITTKIQPLMVIEDANSFQRPAFRTLDIKIVPAGYDKVLKKPYQTFIFSLQCESTSDGEVRKLLQYFFISSFFLNDEDIKKAVPILIGWLGKKESSLWNPFIVEALRRFTGRDFGDDPFQWKNWWDAKWKG